MTLSVAALGTRSSGWEVPLPQSFGFNSPHLGQALPFQGNFFRKTERCSWEGESKSLGTLKAFS